MEWMTAIVAGVIAVLIADAAGRNELVLFLLGGAVGWLATRLFALQARVEVLERLRLQQRASASSAAAAPAQTESGLPRHPVRPPQRETPAAAGDGGQQMQPAPRTVIESRRPPVGFAWRGNALLRWLLTGNVPVKVGVLVSFFGIAFLFKHAVEQQWVSFPIQVRLVLVALFGAGLLGLGWRLRASHRVYALSIQGGGIGVLYLTAYAALRLFDVLPAGAVFVIMTALAVAAGWLAVTQSARQLAVLGSVGGFLAPVLASTGTGSHVALFSYYLVLNAGIAGIAYYRNWRMLNLLGFVFTFGIGLVWGAEYYDARYFSSVEPFLLAFFLLYTAVAVLSALKQPFRLQGYVDSALVFGLPLVAFPLQAGLLDGETRPLAWSATALAAFYVALAQWLFARWPERLRLLAQVYIALGVVFATLAVPLWLDGAWVSNTWALEAAAMIYIGVRQQRALTHWSGVALLLLAIAVYLQGIDAYPAAPFLLNERFVGGFVLCAAFSVSAWVYTQQQPYTREVPLDRFAAGAAWAGWLLLGTVELFEHAPAGWKAALGLIYAAGVFVALERGASVWVRPARAFAVALPVLLAVYLLWWITEESHPLAARGWLAWPAAFAALAWIVHAFESHRRWLLAGACWLAAVWLAVEADYRIDRFALLAADWNVVALLVVAMTITLGGQWLFARRYPAAFDALLSFGPVMGIALLGTLAWNVASPGRFAPLPYLPLANPVLLASVATVFTAWKLAAHCVGRRAQLATAAGFALLFVTTEIARGTYHFAGVSFNGDALWHSGVFQAAVSIAWSVLGIGAMVAGARRAERAEWLAGAALMGVVVVKLFLVDLGNTGSVTRIVSFIGVGLLLLAVGYLAPAPAARKSNVRAGAEAGGS